MRITKNQWKAKYVAAGLLSVIALTFTGCGAAGLVEALQTVNDQIENTSQTESSNAVDPNAPITFEAYIKAGETFDFTFDPQAVVSYDALRNGEFRDTLTLENWDQYFEVVERYWEHMEYDNEGQETSTFMKGNCYFMMLKDSYLFADNRSKNETEVGIHIVGEQTHITYNDGVTYDPITEKLDKVVDCSGDDILLFSDFYDSWDEITNQTDKGTLESYDVVSASGELFLLDSSLVKFQTYKDDIRYFAAYGAPDEYFVIFVQTDDEDLDFYKEYDGAVYMTSGYRVNERYTGITKLVINEWLRDCLRKVND